MKIGKLINPNSKGQVVIPQEYREMLGINEDMTLNIIPKYNGLFLETVGYVIPKIETNDVYLDVLSMTKGAWGQESSLEKKKNKQSEKLEMRESAKRKKSW